MQVEARISELNHKDYAGVLIYTYGMCCDSKHMSINYLCQPRQCSSHGGKQRWSFVYIVSNEKGQCITQVKREMILERNVLKCCGS